MNGLLPAVGVALIAVVGHDIFTVLFRPGAVSRLSGTIARCVWALLRPAGRRSRTILSLAGPLALSGVIVFWAATLVVAWALIYVPYYPDDYVLAEGTVAHAPFVGALHVSLTTITTLGSANAVAEPGWLQVLSPVEALIGFGLLTASVSWLLQIYPVLSRRRALAYEIHLLVDTERRLGIDAPQLEPSAAAELYAELTSRLIGIERDIVKFPITYYFAETDRRFALSAAMRDLVELADRGASVQHPDAVRLRAAMLQQAADDLATTVSERFALRRRHATAHSVDAFAYDHHHDPSGSVLDAEREERAPSAP